MNTIDLIIFIAYCLLILCVGLFVSRGRKGDERDAGDYFLAGRGLAWWAIGASIIASNISAEQFVGMSGSGYAIGLAMATYEWIAALGLILVAKFFIPIFLEKKIFTMPQFLEERFDKRVKTVMAVFWLAVFIFINLTSILYLGALTIEKVMGIPMLYGIIGLAAFAGIYSIYGGLKAVALTDVVQVVFLVGGGLVTTYIALDLLGEGGGVYQGMVNLYGEASDKFHLILDKSHPGYKDLPGISVILGGLWVANLYYWGCNQYIIQRALAAKSVREAQNGMLFAGFIKLFIPLLVVIPGIAAFALEAPLEKSDEAYPWLLGNLLPVGVKGVAFAALTAAIVSSLASMMNSISTIFTMDIYRSYFRKEAGQKELVHTGRWASFGSLLIAVLIAPMLSGLDQAFQYIQEFTGFVSPGALSIFLAGFFYKRATANGALAAALGSFVFSFGLKFLFPGLPWMDRMVFAGFIKLFIPLLVVIPGIAAFALEAPLEKSDEAYPWLLGNLLPVGVKGVAFAALTAAIVSSLASMMNSISTIFTMDIYRSYFRKEAGQKELVHTGRWASFGSLLIAVLIAPMLSGLDQAFQYIQEFTGFVSPGALSIFLAGFFYKRATANGALAAALGSFVFSFGLKFLFPGLPWMDRMGLVFLMCCALIVLLGKKDQPANAYTRHDPALFHTGRMFNVMSVVILAILIGFYYFWW